MSKLTNCMSCCLGKKPQSRKIELSKENLLHFEEAITHFPKEYLEYFAHLSLIDTTLFGAQGQYVKSLQYPKAGKQAQIDPLVGRDPTQDDVYSDLQGGDDAEQYMPPNRLRAPGRSPHQDDQYHSESDSYGEHADQGQGQEPQLAQAHTMAQLVLQARRRYQPESYSSSQRQSESERSQQYSESQPSQSVVSESQRSQEAGSESGESEEEEEEKESSEEEGDEEAEEEGEDESEEEVPEEVVDENNRREVSQGNPQVLLGNDEDELDHGLPYRDMALESMPEPRLLNTPLEIANPMPEAMEGLQPSQSQQTFDLRQASVNPTTAAFESRLSNYPEERGATKALPLQTVALELQASLDAAGLDSGLHIPPVSQKENVLAARDFDHGDGILLEEESDNEMDKPDKQTLPEEVQATENLALTPAEVENELDTTCRPAQLLLQEESSEEERPQEDAHRQAAQRGDPNDPPTIN